MKTVKITKQNLIDAIINEPLKAGDWVHQSEIDGKFKPLAKCKVCAVGAVLRDTGVFINGSGISDYAMRKTNNATADDYRGIGTPFIDYDRVFTEKKTKDFLSTLSRHFEEVSTAKKYKKYGKEYFGKGEITMADVREYMLHVIEAFMPETFTLHIEERYYEVTK